MATHLRPTPAIILSALLLLTIWSFRLFDVPSTLSSLLASSSPAHQNAKASFIRQAAEVESPTPFDAAPIQEICTATTFRPNLLFTCEGQHGGIGMVRNQILKCVRYAIHAGAGVVVPGMAVRNASDITDIETEEEVGLEYLFDRERFVARLGEGCPGMGVYGSVDEVAGFERVGRRVLDLVGDQFEGDYPATGLRHIGEWRGEFDRWLGEEGVSVDGEPVRVRVGQSFLEYPVREDGEAFVREFGKVLSFRRDTRELAAKVLWEMKERFGVSVRPGKAISPDAFYGAHLRLEEDAVRAWSPDEWRFSRMEDQFEEQFRNLERTGLGVVYVATGSRSVVEKFVECLESRSADDEENRKARMVVTKYDLLQGSDRRLLESLTFDQQALVDFMVLFRASAFMGVAHSSFPWNIALRRHEMSRYAGYGNEGSDLLRDEYSVIMGRAADYPHVDPFVYGLWP